ncbi:MAG: hypothetical protein H0T84_04380 [Tatlockia sp.]|nr:hypothetical protein [Tatlockia sp.]
MEKFNKIFSFLFINSKINSLLFWVVGEVSKEWLAVHDANMAKSIYKKQIRRYLGLGFFLSFIPGTEAFLARTTLLTKIEILESMKEPGGDNLIPAIMKTPLHIFVRTFFSIIFLNYNHKLKSVLFKSKPYVQLNRLNPFIFPIQFFMLVFRFIDQNPEEFDSLRNLHPLLKILVFPPFFIVYCILCLILILSFVLYLTTELILNSLNTLIVEPFKFAYEVLHQLVSSRNSEFAYMPSDDYNNLSQLLNAIDNNQIDAALEAMALNVYQTKELTLIEGPENLITSIETHRNSFFYKVNKNRGLFLKNEQTIADSYKQFENLRSFSYFRHHELPNVFPKELTQQIANICFDLDSQEQQVDEVGFIFDF